MDLSDTECRWVSKQQYLLASFLSIMAGVREWNEKGYKDKTDMEGEEASPSHFVSNSSSSLVDRSLRGVFFYI